jgi:phage terminase large subunit
MITKKQLLSGKSLIFGNNENEGDMYYNFKLNTYVILYNSKCVSSSKTFAAALKVLTYLFKEDELNIFEIY